MVGLCRIAYDMQGNRGRVCLESEPDATTNYKRRVLEEHLPKLPSELTRAQAEALLRCFDCLVRRPAILKEVLRPKLVKRGDVCPTCRCAITIADRGGHIGVEQTFCV